MPIETKTTYSCDRCGFASTNDLARGGNVAVQVDETAVMYDGGVGGGRRKYWLCGSCAHALGDFLSESGLSESAQQGESLASALNDEPDSGRQWDIGSPEPEDVTHVHDSSDPDGDGNSTHWGRTASGQWKGYKEGFKTYRGWPELVRRFGPVREVDDCG